MKKEVKKIQTSSAMDNSCGVTAVVLGILSIIFASIYGIILAIIAFIFASRQQRTSPNIWSRRGQILAIVGLILSILSLVLAKYGVLP